MAGVGNSREDLAKGVGKQVVVRDLSLEPLGDNPVAVVEREVEANREDALHVPWADSHHEAEMVGIEAVEGEGSGREPLPQAAVGGFKAKGEKGARL